MDTERQVARLIAQTWGERRPNPYQSGAALHRLLANAHNLPGATLVASLWVLVTETPDWEPAFTPMLVPYLYTRFKNVADAEKRLNELENGAWPTGDEHAAYEAYCWERTVYKETPHFTLYHLSLTPAAAATAADPTAVYILYETREYGPYSDPVRTVGPFRTLTEVAASLHDTDHSCLTPFSGTLHFLPHDFPPLTATLERLYHSL